MHRTGVMLVLLAVCLGTLGLAVQERSSVKVPVFIRFPDANSRQTCLTIHSIWEAWEISKGAGVMVGTLDHSFGYGKHEGLYAGGETSRPRYAERSSPRQVTTPGTAIRAIPRGMPGDRSPSTLSATGGDDL